MSEQFNLQDSSGEFVVTPQGPTVERRFERNDELAAGLLDLERTRRTGTVVIETPNGDSLGGITLARGRVMDANCGDMAGLEALDLLVGMHSGTYRLTPVCRPSEAYLDLSFAELLRD